MDNKASVEFKDDNCAEKALKKHVSQTVAPS